MNTELKKGIAHESEHKKTFATLIKKLKPNATPEEIDRLSREAEESTAKEHLDKYTNYYTQLDKGEKKMAKKKLSDLEMPDKKASEQEGEDLLGDLTAEPGEEGEPVNEELAKASDDELVKELESRGFKCEGPKEDKGEREAFEMPEEVSPSNEALGSSEERGNIA
jgi:hypothetical protein